MRLDGRSKRTRQQTEWPIVCKTVQDASLGTHGSYYVRRRCFEPSQILPFSGRFHGPILPAAARPSNRDRRMPLRRQAESIRESVRCCVIQQTSAFLLRLPQGWPSGVIATVPLPAPPTHATPPRLTPVRRPHQCRSVVKGGPAQLTQGSSWRWLGCSACGLVPCSWWTRTRP